MAKISFLLSLDVNHNGFCTKQQHFTVALHDSMLLQGICNHPLKSYDCLGCHFQILYM